MDVPEDVTQSTENANKFRKHNHLKRILQKQKTQSKRTKQTNAGNTNKTNKKGNGFMGTLKSTAQLG